MPRSRAKTIIREIVSDTRWGEAGPAIVALKPSQTTTESEIIAHCRDNLARFKCPRNVAFFMALPRNATGKVHKPTWRAQYASFSPTT